MKPNITNTSQTLVVNSYYGFSCNESNRYDVNKKIEEKFNPAYLMSILEDISKTTIFAPSLMMPPCSLLLPTIKPPITST